MNEENKQPLYDEELSNVFLPYKKDMLPPAEFNEKIITMLREKIRDQKVQQTPRPSRWKTHFKIKVPLATAASLLLFLGFWWLFIGNTSTASADFGEMLRRIREATSVCFDATFHGPGESIQRVQVQMTNDGRIRQEWSDGRVLINDDPKNLFLGLNPKEKKAFLRNFRNNEFFDEPLKKLRNSTESAGTLIRTEVIEDRAICVYQVMCDQGTMTVWVDASQEIPVRIERQFSVPKDFEISCVLENFHWNLPLSDSQFSLVVPEGYVLEEEEKETSEKDFLFLLQHMAHNNNGVFPKELNSETFVALVLKNNHGLKRSPMENDTSIISVKEEAKRVIRKCLKGRAFVENRKSQGTWRYVGENVRMGDGNTVICFWSTSQPDLFRVVLGDLTIKDISQNDLQNIQVLP